MGRRDSPAVSVCIPVYNRAHQVGDALRSVLAQDYQDFEIVVLDDGSTDATCAAVGQVADRRIRLESNGRNLGIPASRNRCLDLARGRYVAWLDSDDVMSPRRLSRQVSFLERRPDVATLGGCAQTFHDSGAPGKRLVKPLGHAHLQAWLLFRCSHANTTLMARAEVLRRFGYDESFRVSEDYDLSVRLAESHRMANLPFVLTRQRQHEGRTTAGSADRSFDAKAALATRQLDRIGCPADAADLSRHFALTRISRADVEDPAFLDWGSDWLGRIAAANRATGVLDQKALADVLQLIWAQACLKLRKVRGSREALRRYRSLAIGGSLPRLAQANLAAALG